VQKRIEAMWLANARGSCDEIAAFAEKKGLSSALKNLNDIRSQTRAIIEFDGKSSGYAIRMSNEPLSTTQENKLTDLVKRTLGNRQKKP
jgi:hypothetical protein